MLVPILEVLTELMVRLARDELRFARAVLPCGCEGPGLGLVETTGERLLAPADLPEPDRVCEPADTVVLEPRRDENDERNLTLAVRGPELRETTSRERDLEDTPTGVLAFGAGVLIETTRL